MHILGIVLAVIVGAAAWYWRLKTLRDAGSEVIDSVSRIRGAVRRRNFRNKVEGSTLATIKDPAVAAIILYFRLAYEKPAYLEQAQSLIRSRMADIVPADDMDEVIVFCDWAAKDIVDPKEPFRRFRDLWTERLVDEELSELTAIAEEVSDLGGGSTDDQKLVLAALTRAFSN
jgi:hypothetical protein